MPIAIAGEGADLHAAVRSFLADREVRAAARARLEAPDTTHPAFWSELVDLGWTTVLVPEQNGGGAVPCSTPP
ncbi:acyl-CoA dehydrogenase family protein [Streptomyces sp. CA-100214]